MMRTHSRINAQVVLFLLLAGARCDLLAADTPQGPHQAARADAAASSLSLDGLWRFAPDPFGVGRKLGYPKLGGDDGWRQAPVPGTIQELGPEFIAWGGWSWYHRRVTIPAQWRGQRILLAGEGLYDRATVWIDGREAGVVDLPYLPWQVEVPAQAGAEIQISIEIDSRVSFGRAPGKIIAWRPLSGLLRPVRLEARPWTTLDLAALSTAADGSLAAAVEVHRHRADAPEAARVRWRVESLDGATLGGGQAAVVKARAEIRDRLAGVRPWTPESPALFRLVLELLDPRGGVVDRLQRRIGFRRVAVERGRPCLDGRPLSLSGASMHEDRPEAPFRWHESVRTDLRRMLAAGANCVRLTCYPNDPRVLDACDELGLMVLAEVPLFGSNAAGPGHAHRIAHLRAQLEAMIHRDRHHPSILLWIVSCETSSTRPDAVAANRELLGVAHRLDPSRLATHISNTWDKHPQDFIDDDIIGINGYPSWLQHQGTDPPGDPAQWWRKNLAALAAAHPGKPILITEFGHPALGGGPAGKCDEATQAAAIAKEAKGFDHPHVCGAIVWCWADHLWPLGYGFMANLSESPFGLLTRDRRPKPALAEAQKVWSQRKWGMVTPRIIIQEEEEEKLGVQPTP